MEETSTRLWKRLTREERAAAAAAFCREPARELLGLAFDAIAKSRRMRPQAARALAPDAQAQVLATLLDPGEALAGGLLVALHLGERRALLSAFLDAVGLPHQDGVLTEAAESAPPLSLEAARRGQAALEPRFPRRDVALYFNTLWLQDRDRWGPLSELGVGFGA